jgi:hypothetical protein
LSLLAAYIPNPPTDVETILDVESELVYVFWFLDSDNGSPITEYKIFIKKSNEDTYFEESSDCIGNDQGVIDNRSCFVNLSTLIAEPYNLVGGDSVWIKVIATNVYGDSDYSEAGNGAYYKTEPYQPINLTEDTA